MGFLDESGFRLGSPPNYGWASVGEKSIGRATHGDWCILVDGDRDHRCRGGLTRYSNISFQLPITVSELVFPPGGSLLQMKASAFTSAVGLLLSICSAVAHADASVSADQSIYPGRATVTASFDGMPGTATDFLALTLPGATDQNYDFIERQPTDGAVSGTISFDTILPPGNYVVRGYTANGPIRNRRDAESAPFTIGPLVPPPSVSVDQPSYQVGDPITTTFANMLGDPLDQVVLAPAGSPPGGETVEQYTNGLSAGTAVFSRMPPGTYVARVYFINDLGVTQAESAPFVIQPLSPPPQLSTDALSYAVGDTVTASFANMFGAQDDMIAVAVYGSDASSYADSLTYYMTAGALSGTATFAQLPAGTYVLRAYFATWSMPSGLQAESAPFVVGTPIVATTVSTDQATYDTTQSIVVAFSGMDGTAGDSIALAPAGSDPTAVAASQLTGGAASGTTTFAAGVVPGSYVARAFFGGDTSVHAESAPFTITLAVDSGPQLVAGQASYDPGSAIQIFYANVDPAGSLTLAIAGSPDGSSLAQQSLGGSASGTASFASTYLPMNSYVARAFAADGSKLTESAPFTVSNANETTQLVLSQSSFTLSDSIAVAVSGLPAGQLNNWIALVSDTGTGQTAIAPAYLGAATAGTFTFPAQPAGRYHVIAYVTSVDNLVGESASFDVSNPYSSATLQSDRTVYVPGMPITLSYAGLSGSSADQLRVVSISGSGPIYALGPPATSGSLQLAIGVPGIYQVLFLVGPAGIVGASSAPFTVAPPPILAADRDSYAVGWTISIRASGLPDDPQTIIALASQGELPYSQVTGGSTAGPFVFSGIAAGTYTARAYDSDGVSLLAESAAFTVAQPQPPTLTTDRLAYNTASTVHVYATGLPGNLGDLIVIAPDGSAPDARTASAPARGDMSISLPFAALPVGTFRARVISGLDQSLLAESPAFTVVQADPLALTTDKSFYLTTDAIQVTYAGLPGSNGTYIAIVVSSDGSAQQTMPTGSSDGLLTFAPMSAGDYVATAYDGDSGSALVSSALFHVESGPPSFTLARNPVVMGDLIVAQTTNMYDLPITIDILDPSDGSVVVSASSALAADTISVRAIISGSFQVRITTSLGAVLPLAPMISVLTDCTDNSQCSGGVCTHGTCGAPPIASVSFKLPSRSTARTFFNVT